LTARDREIHKLLKGKIAGCELPDHYTSQFIAFRR